ncbi:hypothetical protein QQF64_026216 [Cirrhinus molitorella]|uniref:Uncharacterized protein n=1 Tax=Cirrhinus molitorella TaxID=172907 RepID=A0ABR3NR93_9TELE
MFYLKTYISGEARKAVEGFFYKNSEDAYLGAWRVLEERKLHWPHLKHIANELPPLQSCGLLIGYDCLSALAPLEVIIGNENEPFAQKTELGWSIIGLCNPHLDRQGSQRFVHRVSVKEMLVPSANDVLKVLESDFIEKCYEDKHVSQEELYTPS